MDSTRVSRDREPRLKQYHQLSYEELAFHLEDSASFRAFARLPMVQLILTHPPDFGRSPKECANYFHLMDISSQYESALNKAGLGASSSRQISDDPALTKPHVAQLDGVIGAVLCISVAAASPEMVLLSPGTIVLPVAPGTFGLLAGLIEPAPGPEIMFDESDTAAGDWAESMSVHPTKPNPMPSAVRVVTILFITVFPFGRHDMRHPDVDWLLRLSDRRRRLRCCPWLPLVT
jgi:hypothetical protein